jgi:hypothetical protein
MPQIVNAEPAAESGPGARGQKGGLPPVGLAQDRAGRGGEGQIIGLLASDDGC